MNTVQHSLTHLQKSRQIAQQMIQQTQQSNQQYQRMLQNEQQNIQMLNQLVQREQMAVQTIQQSLQGHEIAMQRCQEVIAECNRLEQELSGQVGYTGMQQQQFFNSGYRPSQYQGTQTSSFRQ
ncbi:hypothetical protein [Bacillus rubiinfantis]|uniref:hypothetical protein n=1 Tax=Bacillus rubiinfantis TaxID=1499680 RepID=UPI0005AB5F42|nr:hypothetical protein [Bacillus rubiinfantis]